MGEVRGESGEGGGEELEESSDTLNYGKEIRGVPSSLQGSEDEYR